MESRGRPRVMTTQMRLYTFAWRDHPVEDPLCHVRWPRRVLYAISVRSVTEDFAAYFSQNIFPSYFYIVILFTFVIYGAVVSAL